MTLRFILAFICLALFLPLFASTDIQGDLVWIPSSENGNHADIARAFRKLVLRQTGEVATVSTIPSVLKPFILSMESKRKSTQGVMQDGLDLRFNTTIVQDWYVKHGMVPWPKQSGPTLLIWIMLNEENLQGLEDAFMLHTFRKHFAHTAKERGIRVIWPTLDLDDRLALQMSSSAQELCHSLLTASKRYPVDGIAVITLKKGDDSWKIHWRLEYQGQSIQWDDMATTERALMNSGMRMLVKRLKVQSTPFEKVLPHEEIDYQIVISGINSATEVSYFQRMLSDLPSHGNVRLQSLNSDSVSFIYKTHLSGFEVRENIDKAAPNLALIKQQNMQLSYHIKH